MDGALLTLQPAADEAVRDRYADFLVRASVTADPAFFSLLERFCPDTRARIRHLLQDPDSDLAGGRLCLEGDEAVGLLVAHPLAEVQARQLVSLRHYLAGVADKAAFRQALAAFAGEKAPIDMTNTLYLTRVCVAPAHQGQGVGGFLLEALLRQQAQDGHAGCVLHVRQDNPGAIALYQKHGFRWIDGGSPSACRAMGRH